MIIHQLQALGFVIGPAIQAAVTPIGCNKDYQAGTIRCEYDDDYHPNDDDDHYHHKVVISSHGDYVRLYEFSASQDTPEVMLLIQ